MNTETMPSKWRVTTNVDEEMLKVLEAWAVQENRSVSSLIATILRESVKSHQAGEYLHSQSFPKTKQD